MTIHLMETGPAPYRNNFLQYVRSNFLIWLEDSPAASAAHDARFNPLEQQLLFTICARDCARNTPSLPAPPSLPRSLNPSIATRACVYSLAQRGS